MDLGQFIIQNFHEFLTYTAFANATVGNLIMIAVGAFFIWLAIKKDFEPLLLVPIGLGIILGNIPFRADAGLEIGLYEDNSVLNIFYQGVRQGWYPPLIFLGIGAMTDFTALLANPKLMLIGAAAQFGIFGAYMVALAMGFEPSQAAGIAIIGGADGPTAIFLSSKLSPNLMGAIAVCAYSYMALVPVIQPFIMRLLTTNKERVIKMKPGREVSQTERILFPIIGLLLTTFIVPSGLPLLGMLFFGNLLKESGKTTRLAKTAGAALNDIVVMLLGLTVGCSTQASEFLTFNTIKIFALGAMAFMIATASGVCFVKIMNLFLPEGKKLNPLIGNAVITSSSCMPWVRTWRVSSAPPSPPAPSSDSSRRRNKNESTEGSNRRCQYLGGSGAETNAPDSHAHHDGRYLRLLRRTRGKPPRTVFPLFRGNEHGTGTQGIFPGPA